MQVKVVWACFKTSRAKPRQFYKEQCMEGEEEADRRRVGKVTSLIGKG